MQCENKTYTVYVSVINGFVTYYDDADRKSKSKNQPKNPLDIFFTKSPYTISDMKFCHKDSN